MILYIRFTVLLFFIFLIGCTFNEEGKFNVFIKNTFEEKLSKSPEWMAWIGISKDKDKWDNFSEKYLNENFQKNQEYLKKLLEFDTSHFSEEAHLNFKIFKIMIEQEIEEHDYRFHSYKVNQLFGRHLEVTSFLINQHTIQNVQDAKDYISRVKGIEGDFDSLVDHIFNAKKRGIVSPKTIFKKVRANILTLLKGKPFKSERGEDHDLVKDFKSKLGKLNLNEKKIKLLLEELNVALVKYYKPAYEKLLNFWMQLVKDMPVYDGVWQHPKGREYYSFTLRKNTTTLLSPEKIHQIGLREVQRIHKEIDQLKKKMNFRGSLQSFFNDFRNNDKYYLNSPETYIKLTKGVVNEAEKLLPQFFGLLPKHSLNILRVEEFREKSTGGAFYNQPSVEGDRPAVYYINLYDLRERPKYELRALAFHESVPGHHLQISISLGLTNLPQFRRHQSGNFTAFVEGWAVYAERLAKDMGLYKTNEDEFGRLAMELMRACRLVVDTGLHFKKWTKEKTIDYLIRNSDASYNSAVRSVERYIVLPGQATAYMIGYLKIMELRRKAKKELKKQFNIKEFHDQVLKNGAIPLNLLEKIVLTWIQKKKLENNQNK